MQYAVQGLYWRSATRGSLACASRGKPCQKRQKSRVFLHLRLSELTLTSLFQIALQNLPASLLVFGRAPHYGKACEVALSACAVDLQGYRRRRFQVHRWCRGHFLVLLCQRSGHGEVLWHWGHWDCQRNGPCRMRSGWLIVMPLASTDNQCETYKCMRTPGKEHGKCLS